MNSSGTPSQFSLKRLRAQRCILQYFCKTHRCAFWRAAAMLATGALGGCNASTPGEIPSSQSSTIAPANKTEPRRAAKSQSSQQPPNSTQSRKWEKAIGAWWRGWQNSSQSVSQKSGSSQTASTPGRISKTNLPLVTIDVGALAARHPAWKLARALEENRGASLDAARTFPALRSVGMTSVALSQPSFDVRFDDSNDSASGAPSTPPATFETTISQFAAYQRDEETVTAQGLGALENQARDRQSEAIETFLQDVTERQTSARDQYAAILRGSLDEEVEDTQRAIVEEPPIPEMSPDKQLLLTNLRLQLLRNVFTGEEQKQRARAQLDEILSDWQKQLRAQSAARFQALQEARVKAPRRAREAGLVRVRAELEAVRRAQQSARELVLRQQQERLSEDFGDRNARLGIVLPAAAWPLPGILQDQNRRFSNPLLIAANERMSGNQTSFRPTNFPETNFSMLSSPAPVSRAGEATLHSVSTPKTGLNMRAGNRAELIRALKSQAWRDARKQAQMAARRFNWRWQETKKSNAALPDRTPETLQWIFR